MNRSSSSSSFRLFRFALRTCLSRRLYGDTYHRYYCSESSTTSQSRVVQLKSKLASGPSFQDFIKISDKSHYACNKEYEEYYITEDETAHSLKGCMAEGLKFELLEREKLVDVLAGPDSYRDLPRLLSLAHGGQRASNVLLSLEETYADVMPVHRTLEGHSAFVSIMRGCDNMCSYCIVPFTRGRERSRPASSIVEEVRMLSDQGVKEVTLLGQNVNSYRDRSEEQLICSKGNTQLSRGFKTVYRTKQGGLNFADLLDRVSLIDPNMRIRFTSPHPKDFPDEVLHLIQERRNICKQIHLPAQSGSSQVLHAMRRGYTREAYLELVENIRKIIPGVCLSSDFITGFCGETEDDHQQTLSLLREVGYNMGFLFAYSMRKKTHAYHRLQDDVPVPVKQRRLEELISVFREEATKVNMAFIGSAQLVLVEGESKRTSEELCGRNDGNVKVIFPKTDLRVQPEKLQLVPIKPGDYLLVKITSANSQSLRGHALIHSSLNDRKSWSSKHLMSEPTISC
ncbi:mitochondrial tRNA methylthiotransferase CDK5RAP1 isoform X2 [Siphateles boraxobius]|uniref:mitochondrial tRNA methylthiotransferase CDK5RAP1 isoform X2 n=1 Tax=Siphateles boraxobius TaxID=180520 RepID=UPI004062BFAA